MENSAITLLSTPRERARRHREGSAGAWDVRPWRCAMLRALGRGVAGGAATAATAAIVLSQPQRPRVHAEPSIADRMAKLPPPEKLGVDSTAHFSCFRGTGEPVALSEVLAAAQQAEVCLIGETHDDPVAHQLELYLLVQMQARRPCLLSLEMFETDVQPIVDEYLAGLIREDDLLQDARPWTNYWKDYRQMVEFCKGTLTLTQTQTLTLTKWLAYRKKLLRAGSAASML